MGQFTEVITRLGKVRDNLVEFINEAGATVDSSMTLMTLAAHVPLIPTGIHQVTSGYQLFSNNDTMTELPLMLPVEKFTSMYQMCYRCTSLVYVRQLDTSNVSNMMWAFYGCSALEQIDALITSQLTSVSELFHGCSSLHTIGYPLDFSSVTSKIDTTFTTCRALANVTFKGTINVDIAMNGCTKLSLDSLLSLLNALADGVTDKTCKIGSTNLGKLTEEQKAIATNKGWTLA